MSDFELVLAGVFGAGRWEPLSSGCAAVRDCTGVLLSLQQSQVVRMKLHVTADLGAVHACWTSILRLPAGEQISLGRAAMQQNHRYLSSGVQTLWS